jgi:hypothetical protein
MKKSRAGLVSPKLVAPKAKVALKLKAKRVSGRRFHLAKVEVASPAYSKEARQAAFIKAVKYISAEEAVARASLFPSIDPSEFRIIRMPG